MIRRPPRSTLFPSRRSSDLGRLSSGLQRLRRRLGGDDGKALRLELLREAEGRSEEHTSELQSHSDLVCRLLLEKKKNRLHIASLPITAMGRTLIANHLG